MKKYVSRFTGNPRFRRGCATLASGLIDALVVAAGTGLLLLAVLIGL